MGDADQLATMNEYGGNMANTASSMEHESHVPV